MAESPNQGPAESATAPLPTVPPACPGLGRALVVVALGAVPGVISASSLLEIPGFGRFIAARGMILGACLALATWVTARVEWPRLEAGQAPRWRVALSWGALFGALAGLGIDILTRALPTAYTEAGADLIQTGPSLYLTTVAYGLVLLSLLQLRFRVVKSGAVLFYLCWLAGAVIEASRHALSPGHRGDSGQVVAVGLGFAGVWGALMLLGDPLRSLRCARQKDSAPQRSSRRQPAWLRLLGVLGHLVLVVFLFGLIGGMSSVGGYATSLYRERFERAHWHDAGALAGSRGTICAFTLGPGVTRNSQAKASGLGPVEVRLFSPEPPQVFEPLKLQVPADFALAPDGRRAAAVLPGELLIADLVEARELARLSGTWRSPALSPDGRRVAALREPAKESPSPTEFALAVYDVDEAQELPLTRTPMPAYGMCWADSAERLAFLAPDGGSGGPRLRSVLLNLRTGGTRDLGDGSAAFTPLPEDDAIICRLDAGRLRYVRQGAPPADAGGIPAWCLGVRTFALAPGGGHVVAIMPPRGLHLQGLLPTDLVVLPRAEPSRRFVVSIPISEHRETAIAWLDLPAEEVRARLETLARLCAAGKKE